MKIRRELGRPLEPHPIKVVFPSPAPVFPMRLTAAPGQTTDVAIFMAGPVPYIHPLFKPTFMHRVTKITSRGHGILRFGVGKKRFQIGNQDVADHVNDGEWLTRLQGTLDFSQMGNDVWPTPLSPESKGSRDRIYTKKVLWVYSWLALAWMAMLLLPIATWLGFHQSLGRWSLGTFAVLMAASFLAPRFFLQEISGSYRVNSPSMAFTEVELMLGRYLDTGRELSPGDREGRRQWLEDGIRSLNQNLSGDGFSPGLGPMQYYFTESEDGSDLIRMVLSHGGVVEESVDGLVENFLGRDP